MQWDESEGGMIVYGPRKDLREVLGQLIELRIPLAHYWLVNDAS